MEPAQPPLPTARSFPFHVTGRACPPAASAAAAAAAASLAGAGSGSHTSILMFESLDGLSVAAIRQNAGRLISVALNGVVNDPAGTLCAIAIVVFGSESDVRLSHV